ncbi:hypothetical protein [Streptomyces chattanoogensis]|uniref:hypothetical protein n=1 Tax=Streptomyces chattanoogensis TaxID=66876 RepID=UPI00099C9161|nr:hypothetical protein [Streptomyces chattanoogensis]
MNVEDSNALPGPNSDPVVSAGIEIAMKWGAALGGPEQLKVALEALEPQLKREHQIRLRQLELQRESTQRAAAAATRAAERKNREIRERRQHAFQMTSLYAGAVVSVAMLGAGVYIAKEVWWLATLLCGPSLIALAKIFVLRRSDTADMKAVARSARTATNAAAQAQPPSPPVP